MLALIYAQDRNGGIGKNNALPWHNREDLLVFRDMTKYGVVAMGRRTWDSLPDNRKPLPMRENIVLSKSGQFSVSSDYSLVQSIEHLNFISQGRIVFVIGGASIIKQTIPYATMVFRTTMDEVYDCDTFVDPIEDKFHEESCLTLTSSEVRTHYSIYVKDKTFRHSPKYTELQRRYLQATKTHGAK